MIGWGERNTSDKSLAFRFWGIVGSESTWARNGSKLSPPIADVDEALVDWDEPNERGESSIFVVSRFKGAGLPDKVDSEDSEVIN